MAWSERARPKPDQPPPPDPSTRAHADLARTGAPVTPTAAAVTTTAPVVYDGLVGSQWTLRDQEIVIRHRGSEMTVMYSNITDIEVKPLDLVSRGHIRLSVNGVRSKEPAPGDWRAIVTPGMGLRMGAVNAELTAFADELKRRVAAAGRGHTAVTVGQEPTRQRASAPLAYRPPGENYPGFPVVGESHHISELRAVLGKLRPNQDRELMVEATVESEPTNRHDPGALAVRIHGGVVGYVSREDAPRFREVVNRVESAGARLTVPARVWGRGEEARGLFASVLIGLPQPHLIAPVNATPPEPYSLIPWGSRFQVSGTESRLHLLAPYLRHGQEVLLIGTLITKAETTAKGARDSVEVHVDGEPIGVLSAVTTRNLAPVLAHLSGRGLAAATWVRVHGSSLAADLTIHTTKAVDIPEAWLSGPPVTLPAFTG
jgi:hypothetical protein